MTLLSTKVAMPLTAVSLVVVASAFTAAPSAPAPSPTPSSLIREDDLTMESVLKRLEAAPDDAELLTQAAALALDEDEGDLALWYSELARLAASGTKLEKAMVKNLSAMRDEVDAELPIIGGVSDDYSKAIFNFANACKRQKYYANAADALGLLIGTRYDRDAKSALSKLFNKKKAIEAMLESGVPVKVEVRSRRSAKTIRKLDAKHSEWDNAYEAEGKNYTVKTNMGVEIGDEILSAMEQMNRFYRLVFEHKERGQSMKRCEVRVYKTRDEFDGANPDIGETVGGFFMPGENSVTTYDPRTASGFMKGDLDEMWSTLYHEASHQFTHAVWKRQIPTWLNEGTASYFEGAALLPGGVVETNRIPTSRLRNLVVGLGNADLLRGEDHGPDPKPSQLEKRSDFPTTKTVIAYMAPGSYPGAYYPFGWGLVYFCMNYENEESERIYQPIYKAFMRSYVDSDKRSPVKRFEDFFVHEAGIEGIESFEDWERRFRNWIFELARREFGGPDQAEKLIAAAEKQIGNEKHEYAADSLRWALRKRPGDPKATLLLAQCYEELDRDDAALFFYRDLFDTARLSAKDKPLKLFEGTAGEAQEAAIEGMLRINKSLGKMFAEQVPTIVAGATEEADAWVEAGFPRLALQSLALASEVLGGDAALAARSATIIEEAGVDVRRTRRMALDEDLEGWRTSSNAFEYWSSGDDAGLDYPSDRPAQIVSETPPPTLYRYSVDFDLSGDKNQPIVGLVFADGGSGGNVFARIGKGGRFGLLTRNPETGEQELATEGFERGPATKEGKFTMSIEVGPQATRFFVDDEEVGKFERPATALSGRVGVFTFGAGKFLNPRLRF